MFKRTVGFMLFFVGLVFSANAQSGVYFDIGLGFGKGITKLAGENVADAFNSAGVSSTEVGVDLGLKLGYGPFGNVPLYAVANLGGTGHRVELSGLGHMQFNSYVIGAGVIFYPVRLLQLSADIGFSSVANDISLTGISVTPAKSDGGFAWDVGIALDFGKRNHGFLLGFKYFNAINTLETGSEQNQSFIGVFLKYAYRHKIQKKQESKEDEENVKSE